MLVAHSIVEGGSKNTYDAREAVPPRGWRWIAAILQTESASKDDMMT